MKRLAIGALAGLIALGTYAFPASRAEAASSFVVEPQLAAGYYHNIGLVSDGTVWSWGNGNNGALGDGTTGSKSTPAAAIGMSGVKLISSGIRNGFAVKADGTAWGWGQNADGQVGDGTGVDQSKPVQIVGIADVVAISGGIGYHTLAAESDGTVWAWGDNSSGQVGDGTTTKRLAPVQVPGLTGVVQVSAGGYHSLALKSDGTVWGWGYNKDGEAGIGTVSTAETIPKQVPGLTDVVAISAGNYHNLALKRDGTLWAWGMNTYGELGDGTNTSRSTPVQVSGLTDIVSFSAGGWHSLAVKRDGTVWAWGYNNYGQLGNGTTSVGLVPGQVAGLSGISLVAAGAFHSAAMRSDGTVYGWGYNGYGQFGNGTATASATPVLSKALLDNTPPSVSDAAIAVSAVTSSSLTLSWSKATDNMTEQPELQYLVYRSTSNNISTASAAVSKGTAIGVFAKDLSTLDVTGLNRGTKYYFNVVVKDGSGRTSAYATAQATTKAIVGVAYYGNGSTSGAVPVDSGTYEQGTSIAVLGNSGELARTGYTFGGWNTKANGTGMTYAEGDTIVAGASAVNLYAKWVPVPKYAVVYHGNGSTQGSVPVDPGAYEAGATATVQDEGSLARAGYTFIGWNTQADGGGTAYAAGSTLTVGTADVELYAQWTKNPTYRLSYFGNGNTDGAAPVDAIAYETGAVVTLQDEGSLVRAGYTFAGWNTQADGGGTAYAAGSTLTVGTADVELYAQWTKNPTYTVTYFDNGNTAGTAPVDSAEYEAGATVTVADKSDLAKSGYTFGGWNTQADGSGTAYAAGSTLTVGTADVELYAQWTKNPTYTVTYFGNGNTAGTAPVDSAEYEAGATVTVADKSDLAKSGYTFVGWNTQADGSGTTYAAGSTLSVGTADVELYAQWTKNPTYTMTYFGNGNTAGTAPVDSAEYEAGATLTVQDEGSLAKAGFTFAGWNTQADGSGTAYAAGSTLTVGTADVELYAQWTKNPTYTVTYFGNGNTAGTAPVDSAEYEAGATLTVQDEGSLAKSGYTFAGWNTQADGSGTAYAAGSTLSVGTADVELYAQWTKNPTYTVTYFGNGNTAGTAPVDSAEYEAGATVTVADKSDLAKSGYTFVGWNTQADGSGTAYAAGSTLMVGTADVELYAQWTKNPTYTVTYFGNGNTAGTAPVDSAEYEAGATVTVADKSNLAKSGYTFGGWNTQADGSGMAYAAGSTLTVGTADVELYAQWTKNPTYTVTYFGNGNTAGTAPVDSAEYEAGATLTVADKSDLAKSGYTFVGWNTQADGSGTTYAAGSTLTVGTADVELYAQWTKNPTYTVTYFGNGNTAGTAPVDSAEYEAGATLTVADKSDLAKSGYTFVGWNTQADGSGTAYAPESTLTVGAADIKLYAQWTKNPTYTVTYFGNGNTAGTATVDSAEYEASATLTVKAEGDLAKAGYTFAGWNTQADGSGTAYAPESTLTVGAADIKLYAQWTEETTPIDPEPVTFTITYHGNGSVEGAAPADSTEYEEGNAATVKGNEGNLAKPGYTFAGWNTKADGSGTAYAPESTLTVGAADIKLYAQWAEETAPIDPEPDVPTLTELLLSEGRLTPDFTPSVTTYSAQVPYTTGSIRLTAAAGAEAWTVTANVYSHEGRLLQGPIALTWGAASEPVPLAVGLNVVQIVVTGEDVAATTTYTVNLTRNSAPQPPVVVGPTPPAVPTSDYPILIGDKRQQGAAEFVRSQDGGLSRLTVRLAADKMNVLLADAADGMRIVVPSAEPNEGVTAAFSAAVAQQMASKSMELVVQTPDGIYELPAADIPIERLLAQFGSGAKPEELEIRVSVAPGDASDRARLEAAAAQGNFAIAAAPVDFSVTAAYQGRTIPIDRFAAFVKREIPLPDGVETSQVTTAVVVEADGAIRHAPTSITTRDGRSYAVISSMTNSVYALVQYAKRFEDTQGHWAEAAISDMASRLIVNGVSASAFRPNAGVTRAEFAAIIVRALGLPDSGTTNEYADVRAGAWYMRAVAQASAVGLIGGYEDGTFRPSATITRQEAFVMLARAMSLAGLPASLSMEEADGVLAGFKDGAEAGAWAKPALGAAIKQGIVGDASDVLDLRRPITRAETAVAVRNLLMRAKLI